MNPRERVLAAIEHEEPDRVPRDLGGSLCSIHKVAYDELKRYLGVEEETVVADLIQGVVSPSEKILERFKIDTRYVYLPNVHIPAETLPDGSFIDIWGVKRRPAGYYYDMPSDGHPLADVTTISEVEEYDWPEPKEFITDIDVMEKRAKYLREKTDYAVILSYARMGFYLQSWYMTGFVKYYMDLKLNPEFACKVMDKVLDAVIGGTEILLDAVGDYVDVVCTGDDLAMQDGPFLSLDMHRRYIKPRQKRLFDAIKSKTDAKIFFHTDGASSYYFDDLADVGVDIVNPVQVSAVDMDTKILKEKYGDKLCFWGAIDTQRILPYGTPKDVEEEVKKRINDLAPRGGYVLCAVHNIQPGVPPQNICAMYDLGLKYGSYSRP